jgi:hypothetical protein
MKKSSFSGLIVTPASYYSTLKGRYLGAKYKENLERLVEQIVRNPKTANLQFANNIASTGGIGFFTHSATPSPDERFLEVVVGVPETFEIKGDYNSKVSRMFSLYGAELLAILSGDSEIYQDKEVSGYGLNFTWRQLLPENSGNRIILERVAVYLPKAQVRSFLQQQLRETDLLAQAIIFAVEQDGPMNLVSFRPDEVKFDARAPISEQNIAVSRSGTEIRNSKRAASAPVESTADKQGSRHEAAVSTDTPASEATGRGKVNRLASSPPLSQKTAQPEASTAALPSPGKRSQPGEDKAGKIEKPELFAATLAGRDQLAPAAVDPATASVQPQTKVDREIANQSEFSVAKQSTDRKLGGPAEPVPPMLKQTETPKQATPAVSAPQEGPVGKTSADGQPPLGTAKPRATIAKDKSLESLAGSVLEGYVIQVVFSDKSVARQWRETLEKRGYVVSATEAGVSGQIRLRLGNFPLRDEAEHRLRALKQEGLVGIVINLPQAYRPEKLSVVTDGAAKTGVSAD